MKTGRTLVELAGELERQAGSKQDLVLTGSLMSSHTDEDGNLNLIIDDGSFRRTHGVTELARRQLADKLDIPFGYFERMRSERPGLLDQNVNTWLKDDDERRMIRTLDGQVRAVLSDRYRRLDNYELAESVLPILQRMEGARFESVELTATRMYVKVVTPRIQCEVAPGDVVQAGVVITNSEVGLGTLSVQPLIYRLVCRNGLIASDQGLRKTHVGRSVQSESGLVTVFRDDTMAADDKAFFLKVRDVVEATVSQVSFEQIAAKLAKTRGIRLAGDPVRSVEVLAERHGLNERERTGVLRHLIEDAELSAYGLVNAVTHTSQEVDDYDRATELELLGGKLIELPASEWKRIVEAV